MKTKLYIGCLLTLFIVTMIASGYAAGEKEKRASKAPNIEGTYMLVSRKLPDGTKIGAPDVMGLLTYTRNYRNFNVIWKNTEGKIFSYSLVSTYKLTAKKYTETILYSTLNDQISGKEIKYDLSGPSQTVPVTLEYGRIHIKLPFDPVTLIFEGEKIKAESSDFVDTWEKIK